MYQDIIVWVIGLVTFTVIARNLYRMFRKKSADKPACHDCALKKKCHAS
jgi:hypothetical protein